MTSTPEDQIRFRAAAVSLAVATVLLAIKFWAYNLTGSHAIFSDAIEGVVNVVAAALALIVIVASSKPADRDHPYGHGKVEYFSAAFEGGLIAFAAIVILTQAVLAFGHRHLPQKLDIGMILMLAAGLGNMALGFYLLHVGKKHASAALVASGHHVLSDFWTTVAVLFALVLLRLTGWGWWDPVAAIVVGIQIGYVGFKLVRESIGGLMDEEDPEVLKRLRRVFRRNVFPGLIQFHHARVIRSGRFHHIDVHVVVPEFWDIQKAHAMMDEFESKVMGDYGLECEVHAHMDPCRRAYCRFCDLPDCPVRQNPFEGRTRLSLDELTNPEEPALLKNTTERS